MKTQFITYLLLAFGLTNYAQTTAIPDPFFEQALIDLGIDSDGEINGQVLTSDVENIAELILDNNSFYGYNYDGGIDFTGIEGFASLETLRIIYVIISHIDLTQNTQLKVLNLIHTELGSEYGFNEPLDLSANTLLEEFYGGNPGLDVGPFNQIEALDFSNNPNIKIVNLYNMPSIKYINLKNGNNNPDMSIDISLFPWWMINEDPDDNGEIKNTVCIEVDDVTAAQNNQAPYDDWVIVSGNRVEYHFVDNPIDCTASDASFDKLPIKIYPNPAKDIVYFDLQDNLQIHKAEIIDYTGKVAQTEKNITQSISVKGLATGTYILRLSTNKGIYQNRLIVQP